MVSDWSASSYPKRPSGVEQRCAAGTEELASCGPARSVPFTRLSYSATQRHVHLALIGTFFHLVLIIMTTEVKPFLGALTLQFR